MRIPDWLIYLVVLVGVIYSITSSSDNHPAPQAPPVPIERAGTVLPAPSMFDEEVLVEVDENPGAATGTAFAVGPEGTWLTARHVVDGCSDLAIAIGRRKIVPVTDYQVWDQGDLALLQTDGGPDRAELDLNTELKVGQYGFHIGYPQAKPGEVTSRLLSRSRLVTRGRYLTNEPVLAWAETGRTSGLVGSLGGISGGPVFNAGGAVVGVTVAESPRRGRIYTTAPRSIDAFLPDYSDEELTSPSTRSITTDNYGEEADRLRRILTVVPVICRARN